MKILPAFCGAIAPFLFNISPLLADDVAATATPTHAPKMIVDDSATKVALGKANLSVSPLEHHSNEYLGSYQLKVTPYVFKSEKGKLVLDADDEAVLKLSAGQPVEFTGKAMNDKNGPPKAIHGKAVPAAGDHGSVSFSVHTDNGEMVFNTSYHLVKAD